jgi:hypothetical protein
MCSLDEICDQIENGFSKISLKPNFPLLENPRISSFAVPTFQTFGKSLFNYWYQFFVTIPYKKLEVKKTYITYQLSQFVSGLLYGDVFTEIMHHPNPLIKNVFKVMNHCQWSWSDEQAPDILRCVYHSENLDFAKYCPPDKNLWCVFFKVQIYHFSSFDTIAFDLFFLCHN